MDLSFGNADVDNLSMINNAGSITEEGPHLSDCEDASSVHTDDIGECNTGNVVAVSTSGDKFSTADSSYSNSLESAVDNKLVSSPRNESVTTPFRQEAVESKEVLDANTQSSSPEKEDDVAVVESGPSNSIYIDDGDSHSKKIVQKEDTEPKRMTMAQRATLEAFSSFGGCDLSSIPVRKVDLRYELEAEKQKKKRELEHDNEDSPASKRPKTSRQAARLEAEMTFKDISLADGKRSYTTLQKLKAKQLQGTDAPKTKTGQLTRIEKAKREALESFQGAALDSLPVKDTSKTKGDDSEAVSGPQTTKRLTKVERARLEALQSFGGDGLQDVMTTAKRRVARTLEEKVKKTENSEEICTDKENESKDAQHDNITLVDNQ